MLDLALAHMEFGELKPTHRLLSQAKQLYDDRHFNEFGMLNHLYFVSVVYYQKAGQWQQAFNSLWLYNALNNDQYTVKQDGTIAWLNGEYETEKKESQLKAQKIQLALEAKNLRTQQRFTLAMSSLFVMAAGMGFVFFRLYRKNQRISRQNEELVKE